MLVPWHISYGILVVARDIDPYGPSALRVVLASMPNGLDIASYRTPLLTHDNARIDPCRNFPKNAYELWHIGYGILVIVY